MKFIKLFLLLIVITSISFSCKNEQTKKTKLETEITKKTAVNLKKVEFHIKGMTCQIGCAKLIESKLSKVSGVNFINVSFKDSLGMITYDTNKLSFNSIKKKLNKIAGGDLYKVTSNKTVTEFSLKK